MLKTTLTFDDALLNTYEVSYPIMRKYGLRGILFVPTIVFSRDVKVRSDKEPHMTLDQAKILRDDGWEIGSHSYSHPRFDELSLEQARWELTKSRMDLESWGFNVRSFAFPYGHGFYTKEQVDLSFQQYRYVRTVTNKNPQQNLVYGIPVDAFPPIGRSGTFVIHLVKNKENFEKWMQCLLKFP